MEHRIQELVKKLDEFNQTHLLQYISELEPKQKQSLIEEIATMDFRILNKVNCTQLFTELYKNKSEESIPALIEPCPNIHKTRNFTGVERQSLHSTGVELISQGKVAALCLAGGQGTRLGFAYPKGMYNIGMPSQKCLFQYQSERILKLQDLATERYGSISAPIPFFIMTNQETLILLKDFFETHDNFGLSPDQLFFFPQEMMPAIDLEGKLLMEDKHKISLSPKGNGAVYLALASSGALDQLESRGVEYVHMFSVDNVLIKVCDPLFVGFTAREKADMASKVVAKTSWSESIGVIGLRGALPCVLEYSEIPPEMAKSVNEQGDLVFNAGNILNHIFTTKLLKRLTGECLEELQMQYHLAIKKVPYIKDGTLVKPTQPNALKFELFYFDAFRFAQKHAVLEIIREEEFAPVKNAPGESVDSPDSARKLMSELHAKWLVDAGAILVEEYGHDRVCEISPLISYGGEGLEAFKKQRLIFPIYIYY